MTKETKDHYRLAAADTPKGDLVGLFNNAGSTTEVAELVRRRHEEALKGNTNIIENNSSGSSDKKQTRATAKAQP